MLEMLSTVFMFIGAILCFSLIVLAHELGHFLTALKCGIPVEEFAMGLGPQVLSIERGGIRYSLRLFPIGAFVRLVGDEDSKDSEAKISYQAIAVGKRIAMTAAGPIANFILAVVVFTALGIFSGISSDAPIIGAVLPGSVAEAAGFRAGDRLVYVDEQSITQWLDAVRHINAAPEREIHFVIERDAQMLSFFATPLLSDDGMGRIGIASSVERYNIFVSLRVGISNTFYAIGLFYSGIAEAIVSRAAPDLIGPVGIIQVTGEMARSGFADLIWFMAFISINLGVVNLLPIPPLDGAKVLLMTVEKIRGKPLPAEREGMIHMVGFVCLLSLIALVTFGDIFRLFSR